MGLPSADTLEGLAELMGMENLVEELYNSYKLGETVDPFGKSRISHPHRFYGLYAVKGAASTAISDLISHRYECP